MIMWKFCDGNREVSNLSSSVRDSWKSFWLFILIWWIMYPQTGMTFPLLEAKK
jgi:hypothetical protein